MSQALKVDVFFDFICPWCLIGKRQLEHALEQLRIIEPQVVVEVAWHGVQLLPHLPVEGVPFAIFYKDRLGSVEAVRQRQTEVQRAAEIAGLDLDLSRLVLMPNSSDAHRLLACATPLGTTVQRDALLERLFAAYFQLGENLSDGAILLAIAAECGYDSALLATATSGTGHPYFAPVPNGMTRGVPHYVFDGSIHVSGAQRVEILSAALRQALSLRQESRA